ncbi:MAG TPA: Crp/Fnr family transcriptional regulator [Candidatus Saccharimonadales bacterium]|nr:Crp/Fnr family transcriptional regulator [Candidatus Saccharimonadales bacterium]
MTNTDIASKTAHFFTDYPLRTFDKRQLLIRAESQVEYVFYIVEGRVSQYDITPAGNEVVVNVFKPGAFFPMSSAINATPNHYFFEASTNTTVHAVPVADAVQFLKDNPDILFDLLARVYRGVDGILRRMAHLMGGDAKTRLSFELLNAAYRFGEQQQDGSILIVLSEGELAKHSGLARETVSRLMQGLKIAGLVEVTPQGIAIPDTHKLEAQLGSNL